MARTRCRRGKVCPQMKRSIKLGTIFAQMLIKNRSRPCQIGDCLPRFRTLQSNAARRPVSAFADPGLGGGPADSGQSVPFDERLLPGPSTVKRTVEKPPIAVYRGACGCFEGVGQTLQSGRNGYVVAGSNRAPLKRATAPSR